MSKPQSQLWTSLSEYANDQTSLIPVKQVAVGAQNA